MIVGTKMGTFLLGIEALYTSLYNLSIRKYLDAFELWSYKGCK